MRQVFNRNHDSVEESERDDCIVVRKGEREEGAQDCVKSFSVLFTRREFARSNVRRSDLRTRGIVRERLVVSAP